MTMRSKTTIFNAALLRTGHSDTPEGDGSALWRAMDANYDEIVRSCFEDGDGVFDFGKTRRELTSRAPGTFGYDDSYYIDPEILHVTEVFLGGNSAADLLEPWEIAESRLLVNANERKVEIECVRQGLEYTWSAGFTLAIQRRLEAVIKDVLEEVQEAQARDQDADFQILKAGVKASKNRSAERVANKDGGRLIRARRRGSRWHG